VIVRHEFADEILNPHFFQESPIMEPEGDTSATRISSSSDRSVHASSMLRDFPPEDVCTFLESQPVSQREEFSIKNGLQGYSVHEENETVDCAGTCLPSDDSVETDCDEDEKQKRKLSKGRLLVLLTVLTLLFLLLAATTIYLFWGRDSTVIEIPTLRQRSSGTNVATIQRKQDNMFEESDGQWGLDDRILWQEEEWGLRNVRS